MENKQIVFTFNDMISSLRGAFQKFPDVRTGNNKKYEVMDAASAAFSVFFTQCPSFLAYQKLMESRYGLSNARTLFMVHDIPADNQIRKLLDPVSPDCLSPVFENCFQALREGNYLETYRVKLGQESDDLLLALDGTQYFASDTISCANCSPRHVEGKQVFLHTVVTPTIVAPGTNKVVSLAPEYITPQDGDQKQDSELKAAKRWIQKFGDSYARLGTTILGDDLYCHEPFVREILQKKLNFIFVCKPESHKTLYEWIRGILESKRVKKWTGKYHEIYTYRFVSGVPLRDSEDSLTVNFVEVEVVKQEDGKRLYKNAWVTNHVVNEDTVEAIVISGRARWKIENENNGTLKTQGYHLEHNFGHGKNHLSQLLATMNILAFLFHTCLEFMNNKYQLLRKVLGARKTLFDDIRVLLSYHVYKSFDSLLDFMIKGLKKPYRLEDLHYPL